MSIVNLEYQLKDVDKFVIDKVKSLSSRYSIALNNTKYSYRTRRKFELLHYLGGDLYPLYKRLIVNDYKPDYVTYNPNTNVTRLVFYKRQDKIVFIITRYYSRMKIIDNCHVIEDIQSGRVLELKQVLSKYINYTSRRG